jgi:hypothetical protein
MDVVIPVGPKDLSFIQQQIEHTRRNVVGCGEIYTISSSKIDFCNHVEESRFPFSLEDVACVHGKNERNGWYIQQLFKLYAGLVIPGLSKRYLVIDADTFFLRPISFLNNDKIIFNFGSEFHAPYFEHMSRLHPTLSRVHEGLSGVCHHMVFDSECVSGLFALVESHNDQEFWRSFLRHVSPGYLRFSGASEYEIYFNFMLLYRPDLVELRRLDWKNSSSLESDCDYCSIHWHLRN